MNDNNIVKLFSQIKSTWTYIELWNEIKTFMRPKFKDAISFRMWIEPIIPISLDKGILTLQFDKDINKYIFEIDYQSKIEQLVLEILGEQINLNLMTSPKYNDDEYWE